LTDEGERRTILQVVLEENVQMNGARSLVETLVRSGVDTCFANPGTSEMHFVAALDQSAGVRCVLGLHENVVTGMADGYYRIAANPPARCCTVAPGWPTAWRTCTTLAELAAASSTSSGTRPPTTARSMPR
jgi:glyoxylate carboligase